MTIEIKDWITIISVMAVITGWFINNYLNRRNEIAKKRLDHRLPTLQKFFELWFFITKNNAPFEDPTFVPLVEKVRGQIHLYRLEDEILLYEKFIESCENEDVDNANKVLARLVPLIRFRLRKELNIKTDKSFRPLVFTGSPN